jgi:hypothetical protein
VVKVTGRSVGEQVFAPLASSPPKPMRRFAGVKASVRGTNKSVRGVQSCPENCPGEYVEGNWIHSKWCPWASVLWRSHGKTEKDWGCPYGCPPLALPSGWTHQHDCKFWDATGRTPFDHADPFNRRSPERPPLPTGSPTGGGFDDFPAALAGSEDDDLPF